MTENQVRLTIGALLHDVGKVIYRTGGDIYDVTNGGSHPVYRYAKPLFMGVPR